MNLFDIPLSDNPQRKRIYTKLYRLPVGSTFYIRENGYLRSFEVRGLSCVPSVLEDGTSSFIDCVVASPVGNEYMFYNFYKFRVVFVDSCNTHISDSDPFIDSPEYLPF